jgi:two-component system, NtrC family, sensor kinase
LVGVLLKKSAVRLRWPLSNWLYNAEKSRKAATSKGESEFFPTSRKISDRMGATDPIPRKNRSAARGAPLASCRRMVARVNPVLGRLPASTTVAQRNWPNLSVTAWMILAVALIAAAASWDAQNEASAALSDFGTDQAALAKSAADTIAARVHTSDGPALVLSQIVDAAPRVTQVGTSVVLVSAPDSESWTTQDGRKVQLPPIASERQDGWARLSRPEAASLGLPARTAIAGFATFEVAKQTWRVAMVTSAERERDRERRAQGRLLLSVLLAGGLVLAFGGLALRNQRKELELARELAIADVQRKLDERLVRADKLATLGALAIGVSHEVATPLGIIVGRTEQITPVADDVRIKRNVQVILEQCDRIDKVIRGMLALARGDSPLLERVEPGSIARRATELVAHRFVTAAVTLGSEVADDLPRIACEPHLLEQAIANLLLNACDACDAGSGHVELRVEGDAARVAFIVTDNGKGIAQESMARVLEPFFTTKRAGEGTGLGLSIANEIVRHNRGTLTIAPRRSSSDAKNAGTRACIEIPAVPRDA